MIGNEVNIIPRARVIVRAGTRARFRKQLRLLIGTSETILDVVGKNVNLRKLVVAVRI